jgi:hypothetical protein
VTREQKVFALDQVAEALALMSEAKMVAGHYIKGYDIPVIERLTEGLITFSPHILIDTLEMSKQLCKLPSHGLKAWGKIVGLDKMDAPDFGKYHPSMIPYCARDVDLNVLVFDVLVELLFEQVNIDEKYAVLYDYLAEIDRYISDETLLG